jgi:uncharacterized protein YcfJ
MADIKKDHSIGAGTGAAAGAVTGATIGAVGGPVGMAAGAVVGGIAGAAAGDSIAEAVNPTTYNDHWKSNYTTTPYYASGREWNDYEPAYNLGYNGYSTYRGKRFEDVETDLERNWDKTKGNSRLAWNEAKGAVRDGWHYIERALPGDADGDGR